jgi:hypothetical protein
MDAPGIGGRVVSFEEDPHLMEGYILYFEVGFLLVDIAA